MEFYDDSFLSAAFICQDLLKHSKYAEVGYVISKVEKDPLQGLIVVDTLQRLGIDYYFQEEIKAILKKQHVILSDPGNVHHHHNVYEVSLRFRLLRQEGYQVSQDVFNNFKDKEGNFKLTLGNDLKGLMALYEASQLSMVGEDILDEAEEFSAKLLNEWLTCPNTDDYQSKIVAHTLKHPHHKTLAKFMVKTFVNNLEVPNEYMNVLLELVKMDFNVVQSIHQKEILQVMKWWKDVGLAKELKFARDQPVKWYMWSMAVLTDPILSEQRVELTKPISLVYIIDDIFDVYGTLDELTLFTQAINRWDLTAANQLPEHMKMSFTALYNTTESISKKVYEKHGWNPTDSLQKSWKKLCNAFLLESEWFAAGQLPKTEDYLKNGIVSSGVHVVLVHMFFLLGQGITKQTVRLLDDVPASVSATAKILRLFDDLGTAKDENQDGHDGSYLECYMKEHPNISIQKAREHVSHMIAEEWKQLNQECLSANPFPPTFNKACLNVARMVPFMYSYDDNYNLPGLKEHMKSIL